MDNIHDVEVLLVEDNLDEAGLVIRALKKNNLGNNLVHLEDGAEALDFIFARGAYSDRKVEFKPKVVLLDLKMPKVDGLQVLKEIRNDKRTKLIPVVIMTSSAEQKDIIESYGLGVNAYVVKPLDFENFYKVMIDLGLFWLLVNQPPG
ncbi:two-component system, unclassified family, response regulator [Reichenbachiella faecimaris]|uniref:Two-component system, unclassified family, response regulator n=1 Tax=Reichenbachiella faecimaris TaxID=692418 RepID=A0A1W2GIA3_REIFA|nr:response regulator [Reichenbachiella faecimaris]SMD36016.1 two-component system, unclassified family, response regulator [Reichenbachiella faecimaris]